MIEPRAMLTIYAFFLPRIEKASASRAWWVEGVSGTAMRRMSISAARKACRDSFEVPEYHLLGIEPSTSPVPGTI